MEATLTFTLAGGNDAGNFVQSVVPTPEAITVRQHHSFVQLPDNQYQLRQFDTRSGFIPVTYMDYATPGVNSKAPGDAPPTEKEESGSGVERTMPLPAEWDYS